MPTESHHPFVRLALSAAATLCLAVAAVVVSESWFWARLRPEIRRSDSRARSWPTPSRCRSSGSLRNAGG